MTDTARTSDSHTTGVPDDGRDVQHLLDLLAMLPAFDPADEWWRVFAAAQAPGDLDPAQYVTSKLRSHLTTVTSPGHDDSDVADLAMYSLMFFDTDQPTLHHILDRALANYPTPVPGTTARRWAADVAATAWRLYVPREAARARRAHSAQYAAR